jgi:TetR/AcrR family transcriptional regulator, transcriptional repressor for nem operon
MRKGLATRERILDIAEAAVLAKGFGATSIDEIIAEAGITKSGFFYHFKDKNALAKGLLARYVEQNDRLLADVFGRARQLSDDPLQVFLIGMTLFSERMANIPEGHPGCMVATMSYQDQLFNRDVREQVRSIVHEWSGYFRTILGEIAEAYPPRIPVDLDQLARMVCCVIDGGIIMGKALAMPAVLPEQLLMVRNHVKLMFQPGTAATQALQQVAA